MHTVPFNLNPCCCLSLHPLQRGRAAGPPRGRGGASLTLALESDMLSTLEPESAYSAFQLEPLLLSELAPLHCGAATGVRGAPGGQGWANRIIPYGYITIVMLSLCGKFHQCDILFDAFSALPGGGECGRRVRAAGGRADTGINSISGAWGA